MQTVTGHLPIATRRGEEGRWREELGRFSQNVGVNPLGPSLMMPVDAVGVRARSSKANKGTIDCWMQALKAYLL